MANSRNEMRIRRHIRVRRNVSGTAARPRLNVFRSLEHIYAQIIDDEQGRTLASASTLDKDLREVVAALNKTEQAQRVGALLAQRAQAAGVKRVVFDRGGYRYHGRVKALAEAGREAGLEF
ncbi:MAG TPA: 50S ribosomal protein L18 [Anaerolineae bacterium]|nr:50S ribosomal protein L18 [Anaerolineae bacterium]